MCVGGLLRVKKCVRRKFVYLCMGEWERVKVRKGIGVCVCGGGGGCMFGCVGVWVSECQFAFCMKERERERVKSGSKN